MSYILGRPVSTTTIAAPTLYGTKALKAYWHDKRGTADIPRRDDIVPAEIVPYLPNLIIAEPLDGGRDWLYRLVGTALVDLAGHDPTGKRVSELFPPELAARYIDEYRRGVENRTPWFAQGNFATRGREFIRFEAAGLPILARDGQSVWLLLGVFYLD